jgi:hypothetical protein
MIYIFFEQLLHSVDYAIARKITQRDTGLLKKYWIIKSRFVLRLTLDLGLSLFVLVGGVDGPELTEIG